VVGRLVAIADRIDSLVGLSGGARRAVDERWDRCRELAEEIVHLVLGGELSLDLDLLAARAVRLYGEVLEERPEAVLQRLRPLLDESVRVVLLEQGASGDEIEAVLATAESTSLPVVRERLDGLRQLREKEGFVDVVVTARRLLEILGDSAEHALDPTLLVEEAEKDLFVLFQKLRGEIDRCLSDGRWERWLRLVRELAAAAERFVTEVLIHDDNERLRANRLALLQGVHRLLSRRVRLAALSVEEQAPAPSPADSPSQVG
jgi:glycyl-tRNA synthetase beta chain